MHRAALEVGGAGTESRLRSAAALGGPLAASTRGALGLDAAFDVGGGAGAAGWDVSW